LNEEPFCRRWHDDDEAERVRAPKGLPKWVLGIGAIVALVAIAAILLQSFAPSKPEPMRIDPLGLITPPDPLHDAPQRTFEERPPKRAEFVGVDACRECHSERVASYLKTPHFLSSRSANEQTILGDTRDGTSHPTAHPALQFEIENRDGRFWQTAVVKLDEDEHRYSKPFDIVLGSGLHAQTFLYWERTRLYQLPLTYSTELDSWTKSPGYPKGTANYSRAASSGCLRCHVSTATERDDAWNSYDRESVLLGISCERCHGGGSDHIAFRRKQGEKSLEDDPIVRPEQLSRARQIDLCAQCHAGVGEFHQPPFSYHPGDPLDEFIRQRELEQQSFGVHSTNQLARLRLSKCFGGPRGEMTCTTCHNPHASERGDLKHASQSCLACHESESCAKYEKWGEQIESNCIDCHMPTARDQDADLATRDEFTFPLMRDHFIGRYPTLSDQVERRWSGVEPPANDETESNR